MGCFAKLFKPKKASGDQKGRMKGGGQFFVACGNASVGFKFLEEILYQMPLFIEMLVIVPLNKPIGTGRYNRDLMIFGSKL